MRDHGTMTCSPVLSDLLPDITYGIVERDGHDPRNAGHTKAYHERQMRTCSKGKYVHGFAKAPLYITRYWASRSQVLVCGNAARTARQQKQKQQEHVKCTAFPAWGA